MVEEAGQVLEAHIIASLVPSGTSQLPGCVTCLTFRHSRASHLYRRSPAVAPKRIDVWWVTNSPHRANLNTIGSSIYG